jgi:diguanylate cyclase (GGDEF)-like protein
LDNFKPVNDEYGHDVGDVLLQEAAKRISNCVRQADTVARFGGDEFVVLLSELVINFEESSVQAGIVAEKIRSVLAEPYMLNVKNEQNQENTVEHHCTSSIGVVLFLNHDGSATDIVKWADLAMYEAKSAGRNQIRYYKAGNESRSPRAA